MHPYDAPKKPVLKEYTIYELFLQLGLVAGHQFSAACLDPADEDNSQE